MEIPNAVVLGNGTAVFVQGDAEETARSLGLRAASLPPPEYERHLLRRLCWREYGMRFDDMSVRDVEEARAFLLLEQRHPHRAERAGVEATRGAQ